MVHRQSHMQVGVTGTEYGTVRCIQQICCLQLEAENQQQYKSNGKVNNAFAHQFKRVFAEALQIECHQQVKQENHGQEQEGQCVHGFKQRQAEEIKTDIAAEYRVHNTGFCLLQEQQNVLPEHRCGQITGHQAQYQRRQQSQNSFSAFFIRHIHNGVVFHLNGWFIFCCEVQGQVRQQEYQQKYHKPDSEFGKGEGEEYGLVADFVEPEIIGGEMGNLRRAENQHNQHSNQNAKFA